MIFLKEGHYYKWKYAKTVVFKAELCQFCNSRNVKNYQKCFFAGRGQIKLFMPLVGCLDESQAVEEITEAEYNKLLLQHMIEEVL